MCVFVKVAMKSDALIRMCDTFLHTENLINAVLVSMLAEANETGI